MEKQDWILPVNLSEISLKPFRFTPCLFQLIIKLPRIEHLHYARKTWKRRFISTTRDVRIDSKLIRQENESFWKQMRTENILTKTMTSWKRWRHDNPRTEFLLSTNLTYPVIGAFWNSFDAIVDGTETCGAFSEWKRHFQIFYPSSADGA